jgi:hypothetical protein
MFQGFIVFRQSSLGSLLPPNHTRIVSLKFLIIKHSKTSLVQTPLIWVLNNTGCSSLISPPEDV